jgi:acetylornithine deacetylase
VTRPRSTTHDPALDAIHTAVDARRHDLIDFLQRLVRVESLPGHEHDAHRLVAERLHTLQLQVDTVPCDTEQLSAHPAFSDDGIRGDSPRINIVGRWPASRQHHPHDNGAGNGRSLILNGHLDVVPPGDATLWTRSPWSGHLRESRIYGRGACDMKGGVTAGIYALAALRDVGFEPLGDILLETVSGEESGGIGTLATVVNGYTADAAIVLEPTRLRLCPVQAGAMTFRLRVRGKATHACMKNRGVSAIEKACYLLGELTALDRRRHEAAVHALYEDPYNVAPISVGTIRGGDWHSTVPNEVVMEGRFGVFPGESLADARLTLTTALDDATARDPWLRDHPPELTWFEGQFESGRTPVDSPLVLALGASHQAVTAEPPTLEGVPYGSDLRFFTNQLGIPAVLYGPGDVAHAHTVDEFVEVEDVITATKVIAHTIWHWCGRATP